jgi:SAM-dependent methyltransferase
MIRRALFVAIRNLAPQVSGRILDFGCGSKPYKSLFGHASEYVGVDLQVTGHDHQDSRIDVFYDGQTLPFADSQFDSVISFEVFEHVFNLPEILSEIHRVTRPGGKLLLSVPFAWNEHEIPYDFARYTSFGISHLLRGAGYEIIELKKTTSHLVAVSQLFIVYMTQLAPQNRFLRAFLQLAAIAPVTILTIVLDRMLPTRDSYYCNSVVLARKRGALDLNIVVK